MNTVLAVWALADRVDDNWVAKAIAPGPVAGLFAVGQDFRDARAKLAEVVELALASGTVSQPEQLGVDVDAIDAIRVFCQTRKTYPLGTAS